MNSFGKAILFTDEEKHRMNILKIIAIVFVVYVHSFADTINLSGHTVYIKDISIYLYYFESMLSNEIARSGNAIFFFMSGLLLFGKARQYKDLVKRKIRTLLIPFLFWNTFWIVIFILFQEIPITKSFFSGTYGRILDSNFFDILKLYGIGYKYPLANQLWFLRDLIIVTLFSPVIWKCAYTYPKLMSIIGWLGYICLPSITLKSAFFLYLAAASYIELNKKIDKFDKIRGVNVIMIYSISLVISQIIDFKILKNMFDVISIFTWIYVSGKLYKSRKVFSFIVCIIPWTFIIYVFHNIPLQLLKKILILILPSSTSLLATEFIVLPIIIIGLCVIFGIVFKKILPRIYNLSTGSR